jgi:leader peptidase (prepilin peptidase)/N-methyltransferase
MEMWMFVWANIIVFALGASIGSFINVVVYRLPAGLSILFPPSRCPHCLNQLQPYDNIPVLGWFLLKGRCRYCRSHISLRYPVVEAITGFLFLAIFGIFSLSLQTVGYWVFCSWLLTLSLIDMDTMTLPNSLTQSGLVLGMLFQTLVGLLSGNREAQLATHLMTGISGAVLGLWLFGAIATVGSVVFGKTAMGGGDAKLAAMMGAWLGWKYLLLAVLIACFAGALVGGCAQKWGQKIPFGPFLALGSLIAVFSGEKILYAYMQLFFH